MHFLNLPNTLVVSLLILQTCALPLNPRALDERLPIQQRGLYSVVAVDGSSAATTPNSPLPVIQTVTQTLKDTKTITASPTHSVVLKETFITMWVVTESSPKEIIVLPPKTTTTSITRITESTSDHAVTSSLSTTPAYLVVNPDQIMASASAHSTFTTVMPTPSTTLLKKPIQSFSFSPIRPAMPSPTAVRTSHQTNGTTTSTITSYRSLPATTSTSYDDGLWHTFYPHPSNTTLVVSSSHIVGTGIPSPLK